MKQHLLVASFVLLGLSTLAGCAESPQPLLVDGASAEIGRAGAIRAAQQDAAAHLQAGALAPVAVSRSGRYWLVDLRGPEGNGVHYAIATDGTVRERRVMQ